jgi:HK97 family phage portal protein
MYPSTVELLDPSTVTERKVVNGIPQVKYNNQIRQLYPHGDLWHMPGRTVPAGSPFALSPIEYASKAIGTSLAAEDFSHNFFADGGHPSAIIYSTSDLSGPEAANIKSAWRRATQGTSRDVAVLGADLKHEQIQTNPGETQFIETEQFAIDKVCRFWGVPPAMVYGAMSGQAVTYANITDADLNFLKHSLDVYYVRVEGALSDLLPGPQQVKCNRNAILRADPKSRFEMYQVALANRQMTVNEIRALEDLPGFGPDFDVPGIPPVSAPEPVGQLALPGMNPPALMAGVPATNGGQK